MVHINQQRLTSIFNFSKGTRDNLTRREHESSAEGFDMGTISVCQKQESGQWLRKQTMSIDEECTQACC